MQTAGARDERSPDPNEQPKDDSALSIKNVATDSLADNGKGDDDGTSLCPRHATKAHYHQKQ
jgi:hypothetical protein